GTDERRERSGGCSRSAQGDRPSGRGQEESNRAAGILEAVPGQSVFGSRTTAPAAELAVVAQAGIAKDRRGSRHDAVRKTALTWGAAGGISPPAPGDILTASGSYKVTAADRRGVSLRGGRVGRIGNDGPRQNARLLRPAVQRHHRRDD